MTLLLAPTPTVRQTLEAVFQLIVANAPGSGTPTGQRVQVAQAAESLLERLIEGRIREALAKHIAAEAEVFDARVDARITAGLEGLHKLATTLRDAAALQQYPWPSENPDLGD